MCESKRVRISNLKNENLQNFLRSIRIFEIKTKSVTVIHSGVVVSNSSSAILKFDLEVEVAKNANPRVNLLEGALQQGGRKKTPVP